MEDQEKYKNSDQDKSATAHEKSSPGAEKKNRLTLSLIVMTLVLNLVLTASMIAAYDRWFAQKVVTVDFEQYLKDRKKLYVEGKISQQQYEISSIVNIEHAIDRQLKTNGNTVFIFKEAILRNAKPIDIEN